MAPASDWWAKRLASPAPAPAPQANPNARLAPGAPPVQSAPPPPSQPYTYDADGRQVDDDGFMSTLVNAAQATGGSEQVKQDSGRCPECNSGNYFARTRNENGMPLRIPAASRCYDCGFPVVQAGSSRGAAATARNSGPARRARQLPQGHAVTVIDGGGTYTYPGQ